MRGHEFHYSQVEPRPRAAAARVDARRARPRAQRGLRRRRRAGELPARPLGRTPASSRGASRAAAHAAQPRARHEPDAGDRRHALGQERARRGAGAGDAACPCATSRPPTAPTRRWPRGSPPTPHAAAGLDDGGGRRRRSATRSPAPTARACCSTASGLDRHALHRAGAFENAATLARGPSVLAEVDRARRGTPGPRGDRRRRAGRRGRAAAPTPLSRAWLDLLGEATQRLRPRRPSASSWSSPGERWRLGAGARPRRRRPALRRHGDRDVRPGDADHAVNVVAGGPPDWLRERARGGARRRRRPLPGRARRARGARRRCTAATPQSRADQRRRRGAVAAARRAAPALAACVHPGFTEAEAALRAHGVPVVRVLRDPERGFALDPERVPEAADLVVVGNPASPSGTLDPAAALLALRRPGRVVVVDEAFMDLVPGEPGSLVREPLHDVIVVRSLTKALAIPGLRAGYAVARRAARRARCAPSRPPWSANALALAALTAAARAPDELAAIAERARRRARRPGASACARVAGVRALAGRGELLPRRGRRRRRRCRRAARARHRGAPGGIVPRARTTATCASPPATRERNARVAEALAAAVGARMSITVVGIGADGWAGLGEAAREAVAAAPTLDRRLRAPARACCPTRSAATRRAWPSPIEPLVDELARARTTARLRARQRRPDAARHRRDARPPARPASGLRVHPHPSAFALACARLGWPQADVELVSAVGRPPEVVVARAAARPADRRVRRPAPTAPRDRACAARPRLRRQPRSSCSSSSAARASSVTDSTAEAWGERTADPLHAVARRRVAGARAHCCRTPGLPDDAYAHRRPAHQARTSARSRSRRSARCPAQLLWDVGAGSGSIAIEWLRAERTARAIAIEARRGPRRARSPPTRCALGVPTLRGRPRPRARRARRASPAPDAIFVGGGLTTPACSTRCWAALRPAAGSSPTPSRSRASRRCIAARARPRRHAGPHRRSRHAEPLGSFTGWRAQLPVVQWTARRGSRMTVHFIGAGPGAPDLLTLRAQRLIAAPRCACTPARSCRRRSWRTPRPARGSSTPSSLDLDADRRRVRRAPHAAGHDVARLHSGDLSIYSAAAEQMRRLDELGIAWDVTPGVPAFAAAAAALRRELTVPEVAQTVILTRYGKRASADARRARSSPRSPRTARHSSSTSARRRSTRSSRRWSPALRRRLPGRRRRARELARRAGPARHARDHRRPRARRGGPPHGDDPRRPGARRAGFRDSHLYSKARDRCGERAPAADHRHRRRRSRPRHVQAVEAAERLRRALRRHQGRAGRPRRPAPPRRRASPHAPAPTGPWSSPIRPAPWREAPDYAAAVRRWREQRVELWGAAIGEHLAGGETGALPRLGRPFAVRVDARCSRRSWRADAAARARGHPWRQRRSTRSPRAIASRSTASAGRADHTGAPARRRPARGRRRRRRDARRRPTFATLPPEGIDIYWGAFLGTGDEILISGRLCDTAQEIARVRAEAKARKGWMFDTYLLRRTT